jgi:hypothetical protein
MLLKLPIVRTICPCCRKLTITIAPHFIEVDQCCQKIGSASPFTGSINTVLIRLSEIRIADETFLRAIQGTVFECFYCETRQNIGSIRITCGECGQDFWSS